MKIAFVYLLVLILVGFALPAPQWVPCQGQIPPPYVPECPVGTHISLACWANCEELYGEETKGICEDFAKIRGDISHEFAMCMIACDPSVNACTEACHDAAAAAGAKADADEQAAMQAAYNNFDACMHLCPCLENP